MKRVANAFSGVVCGRANCGQSAGHVLQVVTPCIGELDVPRRPFEQAYVKKLLEFRDLMADGGRRDMQLSGRQDEARASSHCFKGEEAGQRRKRCGHIAL